MTTTKTTAKPVASFVDAEIIDGVKREWFLLTDPDIEDVTIRENGGEMYGVAHGDPNTLLDCDGIPIAKFGRDYLAAAGNYSRTLHDIASAIRTVGAY